MSYRFEKLDVWKEARKFVVLIYRTTSNFPKTERFSLTDQLCRAAISVVLNIAEGADRKSDPEFVRFLRIASTSVNEVVSGLYIALDLGYLSKEKFDALYDAANLLSSRLNAFIRVVKSSGDSKL